MGRGSRIVKYLLGIFILFFLSCKEEQVREEKPLNIEGLIKQNIILEQEKNVEFVNFLEEQKRTYIKNKTILFVEEYNAFGTFNIIKRRVKSKEVNRREVQQIARKHFDYNEFIVFQNRLVNSYLSDIENSRAQQTYYENNIKDVRNLVPIDIGNDAVDKTSEAILGTAQQNIWMDIVGLALNIWDYVEIICFLLGIGALWFKKWIGFLFFILSLTLYFIVASYRENQFIETIDASLDADFKKNDSDILLKKLNKNTYQYYARE